MGGSDTSTPAYGRSEYGQGVATSFDDSGSMTDSLKSAPGALTQGTQGNPLLAGALAFGVGAFVASLLPTTETEQSLASGVAEPLKSQLSDIGGEVAGAAKETAQDAVESTKQVAAEAKDQVTKEASSAAQQVKGEASSAKDRLADEAKSGPSGNPGSA